MARTMLMRRRGEKFQRLASDEGRSFWCESIWRRDDDAPENVGQPTYLHMKAKPKCEKIEVLVEEIL